MNPKGHNSDEEIKGRRKSFSSKRKGSKYNSVRNGRSKRNHELARIGPGGFVEALDGNPATGAKLAFVNHVGSFLTVLRHDFFRREPIRGHFQLLKAVLSKARQAHINCQYLCTGSFYMDIKECKGQSKCISRRMNKQQSIRHLFQSQPQNF